MVAAFVGFVAGRIVGLQQFGLGLALAVLLDATLVRAMLVPVADGGARPLELVAAEEGVSGNATARLPAHVPGTTYLTTLIARRIAGSRYPGARPGASCA